MSRLMQKFAKKKNVTAQRNALILFVYCILFRSYIFFSKTITMMIARIMVIMNSVTVVIIIV